MVSCGDTVRVASVEAVPPRIEIKDLEVLDRGGTEFGDAMAVDALDPCGVYFGTTGGQVYGSRSSGDSWAPIVRDLPSVVSVEAQTLP